MGRFEINHKKLKAGLLGSEVICSKIICLYRLGRKYIVIEILMQNHDEVEYV